MAEEIASDSSPQHTAALAAVNRNVLAEGESLPIVRLKDGSRVQTGTVAAMLNNITRYNAGERGEVESELALAIPTLFKVGLFELFSPEDWIAGDNPGRRFVGLQAKAWLQRETGA